MRFEYFRFLLTPLSEPDLPFASPPTRKELIEDIFSRDQEYVFNSKKAQYGFVVDYFNNNIVRAKMGKHVAREIARPPSEKFKTDQIDDWPNCPVFINLSDEKENGRTRESGQLIAFGVNQQIIQNPKACLQAFSKKVNESLTTKGYYLSINPIPSEPQKFWAVAKKYEGQIKRVVLTYTPPNLFNLENSLEEDLRKNNKKFNTTKSQIVLENDAGSVHLPEDDEFLQQTSEYIDLGNGTYRFDMTKGKKTIKSEGSIKQETFEGIELHLESNDPKDIETAIKTILDK